MKTLVVYYTRTGNSKFAAETIAAELGADIEEVIDLKKRQGRLAFLPAGRDAMRGKETEIAQTSRNPTDYDLMIIVQPVWAGSPTPAIRTYVNRNDLSGKKVALFFSDSNSGKAIEKTKALMPNSTFIGELALPAKAFENKEEAQQKIAEAKNALNPSEMEKAQTLAEQQKTIAEAQKATLEAKLPTFDVKAPEGTITADKSINIECHILAYQAITQIVSNISDKIK